VAGLSPCVSGVTDLNFLGFKGREITDEETDVSGRNPPPTHGALPLARRALLGTREKHKVIFGTEIGFNHLQIRYINDRLAWKEMTVHLKSTTKDARPVRLREE